MRGPHDLGGVDGFGPVAPESNEPLFHAAWERRALGVVLANGAIGEWTIDQSRAKRESVATTTFSASTSKWRRSCSRLSERPKPSVPKLTKRPATQGAIWSGTIFM